MKKYIVMPEKAHWMEVEARTAEMAYCGVCSWFSPSTRIAVLDPETGRATVYTRIIDRAGNLVQIVK